MVEGWRDNAFFELLHLNGRILDVRRLVTTSIHSRSVVEVLLDA